MRSVGSIGGGFAAVSSALVFLLPGKNAERGSRAWVALRSKQQLHSVSCVVAQGRAGIG